MDFDRSAPSQCFAPGAASFTIYTRTKEYFRDHHTLQRDSIIDASLVGGVSGAMSGALISFGSARESHRVSPLLLSESCHLKRLNSSKSVQATHVPTNAHLTTSSRSGDNWNMPSPRARVYRCSNLLAQWKLSKIFFELMESPDSTRGSHCILVKYLSD